MSAKYQLYDYQTDLAKKGLDILRRKGLLYLAMEVRTGKTGTSMGIAKDYGAKKVLFLTKKKAISSINSDYIDFGYDQHFDITVINDESIHKIDPDIDFDLVIHDEHHRFGAFPKPGKVTKMFKERFRSKPQIWLSGTPSPESYSQLYHQFWVSDKGPWESYRNFYRWADDYVNKKQKRISTHMINDYTRGIGDKIMADVEPYMLSFTQKQAGYKSKVEEEFFYVEMKPITYRLCKKLQKDLVIEGNDEFILADTPAKLQQKLHQLYSGTIKFESGKRQVLDTSKAEFILDHFKNKKIAIFYKFIAEYECLKQVIGDRLTNDITEFKANKGLWLASQIVSGREGTNFSEADILVNYNIDFSATSYWQGRDRMTTKDRETNHVAWVFANRGIGDLVYKAVSKKKSYTLRHFKKDFDVGK